MIWEGKRLNELTEADVRMVLGSGVEEHKHLDYKESLYGGNDAGRKDFLIDVCAFANAEGGTILLGVPELRDSDGHATGAPDITKFEGIALPNPEAELIKYDARVTSGIEEKLALETQTIKLSNGKCVLVIRIPNSLSKPHCVRIETKRYFPVRRDRHTDYMEVQEIKELVMRTASRQEEAKSLLLTSFDEVAANSNEAYLMIGAMPIFWRDFQVDVRNPDFRELVRTFDPSGDRLLGNVMPCFIGLERSANRMEALAQFHRNGLVRYSQQLLNRSQSGLPQVSAMGIDRVLRKFIMQVKAIYAVAGMGGPFLFGMMLSTKSRLIGLYPDFSQGLLAAGRHLFPIMPVPDFADIDAIIRPFCDQVHQGFGFFSSPKFDMDGKWVP